MKKFTKVMLIIAGICACIGVICMVTAFAMGLTTSSFLQMAREGKFAFDMTDMSLFKVNKTEIKTEQNLQIVGGEDEDINSNSSEEWTFFLDEECDAIDIDFGAGIFQICYDDVDKIQIQHKNIRNLDTKVKNGVLKISTEQEVGIENVQERSLVLVLPNGKQFKEIDLEIAAAKAEIDGLLADEIDITIGAGQANISNTTTKHMEIEVGAGEANLSNLTVENFDIEVGMGQVIAEVNGVRDEYICDIDCAMGSVVVDHHSYHGTHTEHHGKHHSTTKRIIVECGMGNVEIAFQE